MTLRLTFAIDPGLTGAVAALVDGVPDRMLDMPTVAVGVRREVDAARLSAWIRGMRQLHRGAYVSACIELVHAMPSDGGSSAFRFGESSGKAKAVLEALAIPYTRVDPPVWKRHFGLITPKGAKPDKDAARRLVLELFPELAPSLGKKKHDGRADAVLLALWHEQTEQAPVLGRVA